MSGKVFFVVQCPHCGRWRSCHTSRVLSYVVKCFSCNQGTKLWRESTRGIGLNHYRVIGNQAASALVAKKNSGSDTI